MIESPHPHVNATLENGVATIELAHPERRNALSFEMADAIRAIVDDVAWRPETRVLVLQGAGKSFCAGYDVTTKRKSGSPRVRMVERSPITRAIQSIASAPVVRIARLHGHVIGAGLVLAQQCHLRYAATGTRFAVPELDLGVPYLLGGVSLLARDVGPIRAADMVLNCTALDVEHPDAAGLVTEVVDADALDLRVREVAGKIAARPDALLMASVISLDRAAADLLPAAPSDLFSGFFARDDANSMRVSSEYLLKLKKR